VLTYDLLNYCATLVTSTPVATTITLNVGLLVNMFFVSFVGTDGLLSPVSDPYDRSSPDIPSAYITWSIRLVVDSSLTFCLLK
jgi:hypothetical protein